MVLILQCYCSIFSVVFKNHDSDESGFRLTQIAKSISAWSKGLDLSIQVSERDFNIMSIYTFLIIILMTSRVLFC
jgi:hypothetical protein